MTSTSPNGAATGLTMAEFNARAKRIAAETGVIEKGSKHRETPSRFRRAPSPARADTPSS